MNITTIFLINLFVVSIICSILKKKVIYSEFVNEWHKCYFWKDKNEVYLNSTNSHLVEHKNGKIRLNTEWGIFLDYGIFYPLFLFSTFWPLLYYIPYNKVSWCFLNVIIIYYYQLALVYYRFKRNNVEPIDENFPYPISHTIYTFNLNKTTIILIALYVFVVVSTTSFLARIILLFLIIKMHIFVFIDKIDEKIKWELLKYDNIDLVSSTEWLIFVVLFIILGKILFSYPLHLFIY